MPFRATSRTQTAGFSVFFTAQAATVIASVKYIMVNVFNQITLVITTITDTAIPNWYIA